MTQFPNPDTTPEISPEQSEKQKEKAKQLQKLKFYGVVLAMAVLCIGFIWFIFKPDKSETENTGAINTEIPDATVQKTEADKLKAIEVADYQERQSERVRSLSDFDDELIIMTQQKEQAKPDGGDPIVKSQEQAKHLNQQMMSFYAEPKEDAQVAELRAQLAELTARLDQQGQGHDQTMTELELMEKSYELASRHFGGTQQQVKSVEPSGTVQQKDQALAATRYNEGEVSTLAEPFDLTPQERNYGFVTAVGQEAVTVSNAIRACVDTDQTVTAGAMVRLRLLEPLQVAGHLVGVNTPLYGAVRINGQRLDLAITSIESEGNIIPVELTVHDMDGQKGINVPNSMERTAAKEALASIGQGFGTSISFAESAGQQVAMDLTRGVMSGGSQYLSSKMREVKINLKANYQVLLISKK